MTVTLEKSWLHLHRGFLAMSKIGSVILALFTFSNLPAQTAIAPTASQDPTSIDQIWQKASSKYDTERTALLKHVDSIDHEGPFRPDWESLQKYEAPE